MTVGVAGIAVGGAGTGAGAGAGEGAAGPHAIAAANPAAITTTAMAGRLNAAIGTRTGAVAGATRSGIDMARKVTPRFGRGERRAVGRAFRPASGRETINVRSLTLQSIGFYYSRRLRLRTSGGYRVPSAMSRGRGEGRSHASAATGRDLSCGPQTRAIRPDRCGIQ
ncbi:MAG: hypothetical protein NVS1B4_20380 [Gemmatimonadaceae bacterium]